MAGYKNLHINALTGGKFPAGIENHCKYNLYIQHWCGTVTEIYSEAINWFQIAE